MSFLKTIITFIAVYILFSLVWRMLFKRISKGKQKKSEQRTYRSNINQSAKFNIEAEDVEFEEIKESK